MDDGDGDEDCAPYTGCTGNAADDDDDDDADDDDNDDDGREVEDRVDTLGFILTFILAVLLGADATLEESGAAEELDMKGNEDEEADTDAEEEVDENGADPACVPGAATGSADIGSDVGSNIGAFCKLIGPAPCLLESRICLPSCCCPPSSVLVLMSSLASSCSSCCSFSDPGRGLLPSFSALRMSAVFQRQ